MSTYSKLIAATAGNLVAILLVYLASRGFGTCDANQVCTVFGFTTTQVQGLLSVLITSAAVHQAPSNASTS